MSTTVHNCTSCGKPMRSDNTRGAHALCINAGTAPKVPAAPGVARRFRAAAKALGMNPDSVLVEFMARWLTERKG